MMKLKIVYLNNTKFNFFLKIFGKRCLNVYIGENKLKIYICKKEFLEKNFEVMQNQTFKFNLCL